MAQNAFDNADFVYEVNSASGLDPAEVNRRVVRVQADPQIRNNDPNFSSLAGAVPVPLLMLHDTGDVATPFSIMQSLRKRAEESGNGELLVQRAIRSGDHGDFSAR